MKDSVFGPTSQCINLEQFIALKKGDNYHYMKPGVMSTSKQEEIQKVGLAKLLCLTMKTINQNTTSVKNGKILKFPFLRNSDMIECDDLPNLNFSAWDEAGYF